MEPPLSQGHTRLFARRNLSKMVVFCLDWSPSMMSRDTSRAVHRLTRFETCVQCVRQILNDQVLNHDVVATVGFGNDVKTVVRPMKKHPNHRTIDALISRLTPSNAGGTCFFDA